MTTPTTRTDADLGRVAMANWEALGSALAARFGGIVEDTPRGYRFLSGLHSGFMNQILRTDVAPAEVENAIADARAWFPDGLPWRWVVGPGSQPDDLVERLKAAGFEPRWPVMPAMVINMAGFDASAWRSDEAPVAEVLDKTALEDWLTVRRENLHLDEPTMAAWRQANGEMGLGPDSVLRQFVGRLDGRPVASCSLYLDAAGGTAGIYHVDVLADVRGRGFGKAVTAAALAAAAAARLPLAVLTASPLGTPVYLRLGFRVVGSQQTFVGGGH